MILVTGAAGQLGYDVIAELARRNIDHKGIDIDDLDITDANATELFLHELKPLCIIHCAAYTAVDKAEDEPETCMRVNAGGTENIARVCREIDAELIYISTDYVFDGSSDEPYETDSPTAPLSVYGKSKLAGEVAVQRHLDKYYIVRTSWLFGRHGNNFINTILRLAKERSEINVVCDQVGSPTYTVDLAALLCDMALSCKYGVYHATNEGYCSWAEFAYNIINLANSSCRIVKVFSNQICDFLIRPLNSRLSKSNIVKHGFAQLSDWRNALRRYLNSYEQ